MYSLQTRLKALAIAGVMTASVAGSTMSAFAEGTTLKTIGNTKGVPVSKTVKVAKGITLPEDTAFNFTAKFKTSSNQNNALGGAKEKFSLKLEGFKNENDKLTKEGTIAAAENFGQAVPGEYVYSLKEDGETALEDGYGWTCDTSKYVLRVYVDKNRKMTYTILKDNTYDLDVAGENGRKLDRASFSNIYTKRGGSEAGKASLVIDKKVEGDYGNLNQYFEFTVKFDTPDTYTEEKTVTATFGENGDGYTKTVDGEEKKVSVGKEQFTLLDGCEYVFYLKNAGKVSFDDLPAGTTYTLTETAVNGYKAKIDGKVNGEDKNIADEGAEGKGVEGENIMVGENENTATVTNTYKTITITGVVTHSAPFVIMVGALFVAVGGYVVLKKRIEE